MVDLKVFKKALYLELPEEGNLFRWGFSGGPHGGSRTVAHPTLYPACSNNYRLEDLMASTSNRVSVAKVWATISCHISVVRQESSPRPMWMALLLLCGKNWLP